MKRRPTLRSLKAKCWGLFSQYIRRKDADEGGTERCYTCGTLAHWKELQCGHAIGGRRNAVLFDESICRPQCYVCNCIKHGEHGIFATKLIQEHGMDWWLEKQRGASGVLKYTRSDLEDLAGVYKQKLQELDSGGAWQREICDPQPVEARQSS